MKNKIVAYKIPHIRNSEGRINDMNPYISVNLKDMVALFEVPKEYAKENFNSQNYYFLASDLSTIERRFFNDFYTVLEYDYLYRIVNSNQKKKLGKTLIHSLKRKKDI